MTATQPVAGPGTEATEPGVAGPVAGRKPGGDARETLYFALRNPKVLIGAVVVLGFLLLGLIGPSFLRYAPMDYAGPPMAPPSADFLFGTTTFGQDVFAQFVAGLRSTFLVGLLGGGVSAVIGMTIGFVAGYRGGLIDELLNMLTNVVLVIPGFVVLIIINAYLGVRSVPMQALYIGVFSWPWVARAVRAQTLSLRTRDFIDLARLSGMGVGTILRREVAPNMYSYLFMTFMLLFGGSILTAASLDFIGLGPTERDVARPDDEQAVQWSALHLGLWWWFVPPGLGITPSWARSTS